MNQRKVGIVLSYLYQAVSILVNLIYTPIMIRLLGKSEYGLFELVNSTVSYLGLLNLGFGGAYARYYARYKVKEDSEGIARLNGMFVVIFTVIAAICVLCGSFMIGNAESIFGAGLDNTEFAKARILMLLLVFSMSVTLLGSVFDSQIMVQERFAFQKGLMIVQGLFSPLLTLPLLMMGYGSVAVVTVSMVLCLAKTAVSLWYCIKKLKIRFIWKGFQFGLLKEMWMFTFFIFLNQVIDQINWSVDKFLIGRYLGTEQVAIYGVGAKINMLYLSLSTTVSGVFTPRINMLVAEGKREKEINGLFQKVGRIQFMILALVLSGFILFGKEFLMLWVGSDYTEAYSIALLLIVPVTIPLIQNLGIELQRAMNKHQMRSLVYFLIAIVNVVLSTLLIPQFGIQGAAFGTCISLIAGNGIFMNIYYQRAMQLKMIEFWKEILKICVPLVGALFFGILIKKALYPKAWSHFVMSVFAYTMVYAVFQWMFGMNQEEKKMITAPIKGALRKR